MSEPAVCPNCAKLAAELEQVKTSAFEDGVNTAVQSFTAALENMVSSGLSIRQIRDRIAQLKAAPPFRYAGDDHERI